MVRNFATVVVSRVVLAARFAAAAACLLAGVALASGEDASTWSM